MSTLAGCSTSSYRVYYQNGEITGLLVTPDRVVAECEDQDPKNESREKHGRYGFTIHILDEEKTALAVIETSVLDKDSCLMRLKGSEKILQTSKKVYIGGIDALKKPRIVGKWTATFSKYGTIHENGRVMQFIFIKGEDGTCFTSVYGHGKPCPEIPFFSANIAPF